MAIESEATRIRNEASAQAAQMLGEFERNASATRDRVLSEARAEAQRLEQDGRRTAEARRAEIIAQAQADAHAMEVRAAGRLGDAVQFILDQITKPT